MERSKLQQLEDQIVSCEKCPRLRDVTVYPMPHAIYAKNRIRLLIVGRNPGLEHDYSSVTVESFMKTYADRYRISRVGKYIEKHLGKNVWDYCAITNLCKCSSPGNSTLADEEIKNCSEYLKRQVILFKPDIILTLGKDAIIYGIGEEFEYLLKDRVHFKNDHIKVYALYHPTYTIYNRYAAALNEVKLEDIKEDLKL